MALKLIPNGWVKSRKSMVKVDFMSDTATQQQKQE